MDIAPQQNYHNGGSPTVIVLSNLRESSAAPRLRGALAGWQESSDTEAVDQDHFALVIYAGGARGLVP